MIACAGGRYDSQRLTRELSHPSNGAAASEPFMSSSKHTIEEPPPTADVPPVEALPAPLELPAAPNEPAPLDAFPPAALALALAPPAFVPALAPEPPLGCPPLAALSCPPSAGAGGSDVA